MTRRHVYVPGRILAPSGESEPVNMEFRWSETERVTGAADPSARLVSYDGLANLSDYRFVSDDGRIDIAFSGWSNGPLGCTVLVDREVVFPN